MFTSINKMLLTLVLALAFLALGTPVGGGILVAGFSIGNLFAYASPTPSGIGFVETILPVVFNSLNVSFSSAILAALIYHGGTIWLPLVLGAVTFRILQHSRSKTS